MNRPRSAIGLATGMLAAAIHVCLADPVHADIFAREFQPGSNVPQDFKPGPDVDATGLDLSGSTFIGMDLSGARFERCNLRQTSFFQVTADERPISFRGADLRNAGVSESSMAEGADFTDALINGSAWGHGSHYLSVEQLQLTKSYQTRNLSECTIGGRHDAFSYRGAYPDDYPKIKLDLRGFNLRGSVFLRGDFTQCEVAGADMRDTKFYAAAITQRQLRLADGGPRYRYAPRDGSNPISWGGWRVQEPDIVFHHVDMSGWDFSGQTLRGYLFRECRLDGANFKKCDIRGAWLDNSLSIEDLEATTSYAARDLCGTTFTGWSFKQRDLSGFNLTRCTFRSCDFAGADLRDAVLTGADFRYCRQSPPTADQLRTTWSFRVGQMDSIRMPPGKTVPRPEAAAE